LTDRHPRCQIPARRETRIAGLNDVARKKRKRKKRQGRIGKQADPATQAAGRGHRARRPQNRQQREPRPSDAGIQTQEPKFSWVTVENRDSEGNPIIPPEIIESTYQRRYRDVPEGTQLSVHVMAGYKPKPPMLVERKIYQAHRLSVRGWRKTGQIAVEVDGWRHHEADWFNAMQGVKLQISDPGLPGPHNEDSDFIVSRASFDRKIVNVTDEKGAKTQLELYEGTLDITETWRSAWRRQGAEMLNLGLKWLFAPFFAALGAGLTLFWMERPPNPDAQVIDSRETPALIEDGSSNAASGAEPAPETESDQSAAEPALPTNGTQTATGDESAPALSGLSNSEPE